MIAYLLPTTIAYILPPMAPLLLSYGASHDGRCVGLGVRRLRGVRDEEDLILPSCQKIQYPSLEKILNGWLQLEDPISSLE